MLRALKRAKVTNLEFTRFTEVEIHVDLDQFTQPPPPTPDPRIQAAVDQAIEDIRQIKGQALVRSALKDVKRQKGRGS